MSEPGALVGRRPELDSIEDALAGVVGGAFRAVAIRGEPGVGKTMLLGALAERATERGLAVNRGRATEFERGVPFGVFIEAFERLAATFPADTELNNQDGSLTGFNLNYLFETSPGGDGGQCPGVTGTQVVPILPIPFSFRYWMDPRITVDTDHRPGWCDLTLTATGRADVVLDVLWEFNGDGGQCHGALPLGTNQYRTVQTGALPVTLGMDTDNRGGACYLSFRLRHV